MKRLLSRRVLVIVACLAVVLVAGVYFLLTRTFAGSIVYVVLHQNPGTFDRKNMEAIVDEVRHMKLPPDETMEFKLDRMSHPKSLRPLPPETYLDLGTGAGHVWAKASASNNLTVVIETRDLGHAGEYGYAYSDAPLVPTSPSYGGSWLILNVPSRLNLVKLNMKIDDHWWSVLNNLD